MKKMIFALLTATMLLGSGTTVLADDIHNYNILVSDTYYDTSSYSHIIIQSTIKLWSATCSRRVK